MTEKQPGGITFTFTLEGAIALWARSHDLAVTKLDVDNLAEAIHLLYQQHIIAAGAEAYGYHEAMREYGNPISDAPLCWAYTTPDKLNVCILERGHDEGKHENIPATKE